MFFDSKDLKVFLPFLKLTQARRLEFLRKAVSANQGTNSYSSEKQSCLQILKHNPFKNNYIFKIQIILVNILTRSYNSMTTRIASSLKLFTSKSKRYCFSSYVIYSALTFQRPSTNNNNGSSLLLFDGLWKVKVNFV